MTKPTLTLTAAGLAIGLLASSAMAGEISPKIVPSGDIVRAAGALYGGYLDGWAAARQGDNPDFNRGLSRWWKSGFHEYYNDAYYTAYKNGLNEFRDASMRMGSPSQIAAADRHYGDRCGSRCSGGPTGLAVDGIASSKTAGGGIAIPAAKKTEAKSYAKRRDRRITDADLATAEANNGPVPDVDLVPLPLPHGEMAVWAAIAAADGAVTDPEKSQIKARVAQRGGGTARQNEVLRHVMRWAGFYLKNRSFELHDQAYKSLSNEAQFRVHNEWTFIAAADGDVERVERDMLDHFD